MDYNFLAAKLRFSKRYLDFILELTPTQKHLIVFASDLMLAAFCLMASVSMHLMKSPLQLFNEGPFEKSLLLIVSIQGVAFYLCGLYRGILRFASTTDLIRLLFGSVVAVLFSIPAFRWIYPGIHSFLIVASLDLMLLVLSLGSIRFLYRIWRESFMHAEEKKGFEKTIIVGAGSAGERLYRELRENIALKKHVVAFIDHNPSKKNKLLHGVKVWGDVDILSEVIKETGARSIFIAIPSASGSEIKRILEACRPLNLNVKTLPKMSDFIKGKTEISQLRNIQIEDLLGREEVDIDFASLNTMLAQKTVLVTGAGGSIGSELCRQIVKFPIKRLVLFDISEYNLYEIERNLRSYDLQIEIIPCIGDVRNVASVKQVFGSYRPNVVFHAAAYKHVPIMELNPKEAILTNIVGTQNVAELSSQYSVDKFVMISTDKAVRPTNVMGATKRVAEKLCATYREKNQSTRFITVRFGNVLGSSGSVVPLFKEQISRGGPVTVTHPEVKRYFMSIPEACRLVLQAAALGEGNEVFVLDMGEPVKIINLAQQMISLSGFKPDDDIKIEITGLRPGEKLFEELLLDNEHTLPTLHPKVRRAKLERVEENFEELVDSLQNLAFKSDKESLKLFLKKLVPEYTPTGNDSLVNPLFNTEKVNH